MFDLPPLLGVGFGDIEKRFVGKSSVTNIFICREISEEEGFFEKMELSIE